ncbi:hypothetical protein DFP72DRAFT_478487 [Ephemerocybe angulata]|uniref:Secreted protein n=1 Tax=Ephemerocybe angulata TaxID=980116 RepID=A0A8H6IFT8_9AGAR|nr:hypothetical protein DFP72DRAFT_478487 [Tulosesus angulatus]
MPRLSLVLTLATSCPYSLPILVSLTPEWYNKGNVSEETREGLCNEPAVHDAQWVGAYLAGRTPTAAQDELKHRLKVAHRLRRSNSHLFA